MYSIQVSCTLKRVRSECSWTLSERALRAAPCRRGMKLTCCRNVSVQGAGLHDTDESFSVLLTLPSRRGESHFTSISPTHLNPWGEYVNPISFLLGDCCSAQAWLFFPGLESHRRKMKAAFTLTVLSQSSCTKAPFLCKAHLAVL